MDTTASAPPLEAAPAAAPRRIYRHRLPVRLMHWINVVCLVVLLGSGLNIFNAHPALYWGHDSSDDAVAVDARREHAGRAGRQDAHRRHRLRHHRRARRLRGRRPADGARLPELGDDPRPAMAGDGAPLAPVLRLAVRHQRRRLRALHDLQPAPDERPGADPLRAEEHRPLDRRPPQAQASDRRRRAPATTCCRASPT